MRLLPLRTTDRKMALNYKLKVQSNPSNPSRIFKSLIKINQDTRAD